MAFVWTTVPKVDTAGTMAKTGKNPSGCVTDTMRFIRRQKVSVEKDLITRLKQACDTWEEEYDYGVIPIAVVRGILGRYDEVSKLNKMYYGE